MVVVEEIMNEKIYLDTSGNVRAVDDDAPVVEEAVEDAGPSLDDL